MLIREVIVSLDAATNEAVLVVHWTGGRHTELRVTGCARVGIPRSAFRMRSM